MVDLSVGINAQNLTSAGVVVAIQGVVDNLSSGESLRLGVAVHLGDSLQTADDASVVVRFLTGGALALGANQSVLIDESLIERLKQQEHHSHSQEDSVDYVNLLEAIERGESIEELLPPTAAGDDGAGGSAISIGVRFEFTGEQVLPQAGFARSFSAQAGEGAEAGIGNSTDDLGFPAPGALRLITVVQDANGDGYINATENDGQLTVTLELPNNLLPGSTVVVNGVIVNITPADIAAGNVVVVLPLPADGETIDIVATPFNPAGISGDSVSTTVTIDISAPLLTINPIPPGNDTTPNISGTGEPGHLVTVTDSGGNVLGTATVDPDGIWQLTPEMPINDPGTQITATTEDAAGNETTLFEDIVIDTTPPGGGTEKPTVAIPEAESGVNKEEFDDGIQVLVGLPSGTESGDEIIITITSPNGVATDVVFPVNSDGAGNQEVTIPVAALPSPPDGDYTIEVTLVDPVGNESLPSDPVDILVDTTAPGEISPGVPGAIPVPVVTIPEALNSVDEQELADGVQVQVVLPTGTEAGDTVSVSVSLPDGSAETIDYTVSPNDGASVEITIPTTVLPAPPNGDYQVTAFVTDQAGNAGGLSDPVPFTVDTTDLTPPPSPQISFVEDINKDGYVNFDESSANTDGEVDVVIILNSETPLGSTLLVTIDGNETSIPVTAALVAQGQTTLTVPQPDDGGELTVTAQVTAPNGVDSPEVEGSLLIDITDFKGANPALSVELLTDQNNDGRITSNESLSSTQAGTVEVLVNLPAGSRAGDKLIVSTTGQSPREIIVSDADISAGRVELAVEALAHGQTLEVTAQIFDAAGNQSDEASDSATMDLQPMSSPLIVFVDDSSGNGEVNNNEVAGKPELTVDVILPFDVEPGDSVIVTIDGAETEIPVTQQIVDDKKVTVMVPTPDNGETVTVRARVEDSAGEQSPEAENEVIAKTPDLNTGLSVSVEEDGDNDGVLTQSELGGADAIVAKVQLPQGASTGDTLVLEVNGVPRTITLSDDDIQSGVVDVDVPAPAPNQTLVLSAEVHDDAGNNSNPVRDSVSMEPVSVAGAPSIKFLNDNDGNGYLNADEANGLSDLDVELTLPSNVSPGDVLVHQVDSGAEIRTTLTQADIDAGSVSVSTPVPANSETLDVLAYVEQSGIAGPSSEDSITVDTSDLSAGLNVTIVEDNNNDGLLSSNEAQGSLGVRVELPADAEAGDTLILTDSNGAPRIVVLDDAQIAVGEVRVEYSMPAEGSLFEITARLNDAAGNSSIEVADSVEVDTNGLSAPQIRVVDDSSPGDGMLNNTELNGKNDITVEVALPVGAEAGDTLIFQVGNGPEQSQTIAQDQIDLGVVEINLPIPPDGSTLEFEASVTDSAGNLGEKSDLEVAVDSSDLNTNLSLIILEDVNGDGVIGIQEQEGAVDIRVNLPIGAQPGDSLRVEASANTPTLITLTAEHIANAYVDLALNSVSQGNNFVVSASLSDAAGNVSDSVTANALVEGQTQAKPGIRVVEDANDDGMITSNEIQGQVDVEVTLPVTVRVGDTVVLEASNGEEFSETVSQADLDRGSITFEVSPISDGETLNLESYIEDANGNVGESVTESVEFAIAAGAVPVVTGIIDNVEPVVGTLQSGGTSNDSRPVLEGLGESGNTINIFQDGIFIGKANVQPDGTWQYEVPELSDGDFVFTASSSDPNGNESERTAPFEFTLDTSAPVATENFEGTDDVGRITGPIANGSTIDDSAPTFSGEVDATEAEAGSTVTLIVRDENDNVVQTIDDIPLTPGTNVGDPATWEATPEPALPNGNYKVSAEVVDPAGNVSPETAPIEFTVDTTTPGAPSIVRVIDNEPAGEEDISHLGITNDTTPTVEGTGPNNAKVTLYSADPSGLNDAEKAAITLGSFDTGSDGNWSITPSALPDGNYTFYADAEAANGEVSPATGPYSIEIDSSVPTPPNVGTPGVLIAEDDQGSVTGPINNNDTTDDANPRLHGKVSEPNGQVTVIIDAGKPNESSVVVDADDQGNWEYTPSLDDGEHTVQIAVTDEAGNGPSDPSNPLTFTVDTSGVTISIDKAVDDVPAPGAPVNSTEDINDGGLSNDNTPTIVGSAKVGAEVTLEVNGQTYGPVTADGNGQWQIQITDALPEGVVDFVARAQDSTGNDVSDTFSLNIDTAASEKPIINNAQDNVGEIQEALDSGDATDDNVPQLNGTGTPGETIRIHQDGNVVDEVAVQLDGSWTYTPTTALPEGEYEFTATSVDAAGNESDPSDGFTIIVDRTAPDVIENFTGTDDVGRVTGPIVNGSTIDDSAPTFSGEVGATEAEAGSTVTLIVRDENDNVVQTIEDIPLTLGANVGDPATWEATPEPALPNGNYKVSAEVVDPAGNVSPETAPIEFTVDTTTPGAPSIVRVIDNEPAGEEDISHLGITNDTTPTVEGTGPNNAKVTLYSADPSGLSDAEKAAITLGSFDTGADGNWSITPSALADGDYTFYADAEAANGEVSPATGPYTITVDSSIPAAPDTNASGVLIAEDDQGSVTGPINNNDTTDDANPRLHGKVSEPNGQVTVIIDAGKPNESSVVVDADDQGNWEYTPSLDDGEHTVQIAVTDEAGNGPSDPSNPLTFTVDTSGVTISIDKAIDDVPAPGAPANSTEDINDGGLSNDNTPTIVGSAKVGAEVTLEVNGQTYGPVTADGNGQWQIQITDALPEGKVTFTATAQDATGNDVSDTFTLDIDTLSSTNPVIDNAQDNVGSVQGVLNDGDSTDDNVPQLNGTGTPGETIRIHQDGNVVDEVTVQPDGSWTYTPTTALPEGEYEFTATSVDAAGNESDPSDGFTIIVDRTAPDAIENFTGTDDVGRVTGPIVNGSTIDDSTPTFSGEVDAAEAEAGSTVTLIVRDENDNVVQTIEDIPLTPGANVGDPATWEATPSPALSNGSYKVSAEITDPAGNVSPETAPLNFTVDTNNVTVDIEKAIDDVPAPGQAAGSTEDISDGGLTNDRTPTIAGIAKAGSQITLEVGGVIYGPVTADSSGQWQIPITMELPDGTATFTATATDASGNEVTDTFTLEIDAVPDARPVINNIEDDVGSIQGALSNGDQTDDAQATVNGSSAPDGTVRVYLDGNAVADVPVDSSGTWAYTPIMDLPDGEHVYTATAVDEAGNESGPSDSFTLTVNTQTPTPPDISVSGTLMAEDDQGAVIGDIQEGDTTDDTNPRLYGQVSEPNGELTILIDGGTADERVETATADELGNWEFTPTLSDGPHTVQIAISDAAGNGPSAFSDALNFIVDTNAVMVDIEKAVDDRPDPDATVGSTEDISDGGLTNDAMPLIVGSAKPGAEVTLEVNGRVYGPVTADGTGAWQIPVTDALPDGTANLRATARDATGNEASDDFTIVVDTGIPAAPLSLQGFDNAGVVTGTISEGSIIDDALPLFTGQAEPGATVHIYNTDQNGNQVRLGTTTANASGEWGVEVPLPFEKNVEIPYSITARQIDQAGNGESDPSAALNFILKGEIDIGIGGGLGVQDLNDDANTISSEGETGDLVGVTAAPDNQDVSDVVIQYSLSSGNDSGLFRIQGTTGVVSLARDATDADIGSHDVRISLLTLQGKTATGTFTIDVTGTSNINIVGNLELRDRDDNANVITDAEQAGDGVGIMATVDRVQNGEVPLGYTLASNPNGLFRIAPNGQVTLARDVNVSDIGNHDIEVTASTNQGRQASETFSVTIDGNRPLQALNDSDVADNLIYRDAAAGSTVGVTALAEDQNQNHSVSYQLANTANGLFEIDDQSGVVSLSRSVEDSDLGEQLISVIAQSSDGSSQQEEFTVTVAEPTYETSNNVLTGQWSGDTVANGSAQTLAGGSETSGTTTFTAVAGQSYDLSATLSVNEQAGAVNIAQIDVLDPNGNVIENQALQFNGNTNNTVNFSIAADSAGEYTVRVRNTAANSGLDRDLSIDVMAVAGADASQLITPLVLDLDGDGTETLSMGDGVRFDIDADGKLDATGWVGSDDALLVYDRNHDETINDGSELFGAATRLEDGSLARDGFEALRELDTNSDGIFDASDEVYSELQLWQDRNSDGWVQQGELLSLEESGVFSIDLDARSNGSVDKGNIIGLSSTYQNAEGEERHIDDVWFAYDANTQGVEASLNMQDLVSEGELDVFVVGQEADVQGSVSEGGLSHISFDAALEIENVENLIAQADTQKILLDF